VAIRQRNSNERGLAAVYNNIAVVYNIKANHKLAADYNKMAIEISEKYETPPRELIIAYNNLSSIYMKSYNYDDALEWNIKASRVLTDSGLEETPISADIFLMRASIHYVHEEIDEALMLDLKALDVLKAHYPEEHADIGTAYNCVAREYYSLCKFDVAIDHYFKAQNIYEAVYGEDNSNTAAVCGNISKTYMAMEDYQNALIWCLKTLDVQKKNLGEEHPEVILRHSFASEIYEHLGLYGKAIDHLLIIHNYYAKIDHDAGITKIVSERIADNSEKLNNRSEEKKYRKMAIKSGEHDEN
jgi:tetratricopeptide (TPR) repeat protein